MKMNPILNLNSTGQAPGAIDANSSSPKDMLGLGGKGEFLNLLKLGEANSQLGKNFTGKSSEGNLLNNILNGEGSKENDLSLLEKSNSTAKENSSEDFLNLKNKMNENSESLKNLDGIKKALSQYKNENNVLSKTIIDGQKKFEDNLDSLSNEVGGESSDNILSLDALKTEKSLSPSNLMSTSKVNLSNINTSKPNQMISEIMNHLEENKIGTSDKLGVTVKHDELGDFKIEAQKNHVTNQVDLKIITNSNNGKEFFAQNEVQLVKQLVDSGVKISDFSIVGNENVLSSNQSSLKESSSSSKSNSNSENHSEQESAHTGSQQQERRDDADRRQNLWQDFNTDYKIA